MESNRDGRRQSAFTLLKSLKRRKFYLLIPVALITLAVAFYSGKLPVKYRAQTLIASEAFSPVPYLHDRPDTAGAVNVQENLRTIREVVFSQPVLVSVIQEFKLYDIATQRELDHALEQMKSRINILVDSPDSFYVGFEGDQPEQVAQVANRLAALFVDRTTVIHGEHAAQVDNLLDSEVERLRNQLRAQEDGLRSYKESMAQALPDRLSTNLRLLEDLQQQAQHKGDQIADAQAQRTALVNEILAMENQGALEAAPRQKTSNEIALEDARAKLRQLQTRYTSENPEIQRAQKEVRDLEAMGTPLGPRTEPSAFHMRYLGLQADLTSLDQRIKSYQQERAALSAQMGSYEKRINSSPGLESTLAERMKDAALTRTQYETMLAKQQAEKLDRRAETTSKHAAFKVVDAAQVPTAPFSPQRKRMILLAFLASLGLGIGTILMVEHMDSSFETTEEVQQFTNIPVLAAIPSITNHLPRIRLPKDGNGHSGLNTLKLRDGGIGPEERRRFQAHRLTVIADPQSIASQQYGIMTLKILRWREQTGGGVLVVTSAAGGEGKSLTALNLSMSLAGAVDGRVLLVDCDLRRPQVHERLGLEKPQGLTDLLATHDCDTFPFIQKVGNLYVMTGGSQLGDQGGILSMRRTREILARLREEYQVIILDSPPIVPIADSHFLAGLADGVLMVVRARQTRRELLQRAVESLGPTNILGAVLNDVEYGDTRYAYAYRYYQRHYMSRR
ncbi:MAG TPA: AAA family ATPase [Bryobacteraceae bacterium]|nr:AAA family ATPase [Bryobacteraceae bacterium]